MSVHSHFRRRALLPASLRRSVRRPVGGEELVDFGPKAQVAPGYIFILGVARSGTSLLFRALASHPDLAYIDTWTEKIQRPCGAISQIVPRLFPAARRRYWFTEDGNAYQYGATRSVITRLFPAPSEGQRVIRRRLNDLPRLAFFLKRTRRYAGRRSLLVKSVHITQDIGRLAEALPDAVFVEIVRDGRAVAWSLTRVEWWETAGGNPMADPASVEELSKAARIWADEVQAIAMARSSLPPDRFRVVRYEDLIDDPPRVLNELVHSLGLAVSSAFDRSILKISFQDKNRDWKDRLPPDAIEAVSVSARGALESLGYMSTAQPEPTMFHSTEGR